MMVENVYSDGEFRFVLCLLLSRLNNIIGGVNRRVSNVNHITFSNKVAAEPIINSYKNALHAIDQQIVQVLDALERTDFFSDGIVIITSDHGQEFNDLKKLFLKKQNNLKSEKPQKNTKCSKKLKELYACVKRRNRLYPNQKKKVHSQTVACHMTPLRPLQAKPKPIQSNMGTSQAVLFW